MNAVYLLSFFFLLLCTTVTCYESVHFLTPHDSAQTLDNGTLLALQVENKYLKNVSLSLLTAETWVRTHVLTDYPSTNVSIILVGNTFICNKNQENDFGLVLPAIKNIHYSLTRWGLQNLIKVSVSFTPHCFDPKFEIYTKPLFNTLQEISSPYVVKLILLNSHFKSMNNNGFLHISKKGTTLGQKLSILGPLLQRPISTNEMETSYLLKSQFKSIKNNGFLHKSKKERTAGRKLSFLYPSITAPTEAPSRFSIPDFVVGSPLPPLVGMISPSISPPFGPHLPPCIPSSGGHSGGVGAPAAGGHTVGLWCVAKPNVPTETLQEALDFACGEGEADCEAIRPQGSCYFPDNVVAHASYAFNSYWQKNKGVNGGSCGFGGTAMLINSDPSYQHCKFVLG